jgi:hypothetical protein
MAPKRAPTLRQFSFTTLDEAHGDDLRHDLVGVVAAHRQLFRKPSLFSLGDQFSRAQLA